MQKSLFGSLVCGTLSTLLAGQVAMASEHKAEKKADAKKAEKAAGHCVANTCGGHVVKADGSKASNSCKGQTIDGVTKEECTKGGHGTWK